jgi:hypothetical protein
VRSSRGVQSLMWDVDPIMNRKFKGWARLAGMVSLAWIAGYAVLVALDFSNRDRSCWLSARTYFNSCYHAYWEWSYAGQLSDGDSYYERVPKPSAWLTRLALSAATIRFLHFSVKWVSTSVSMHDKSNDSGATPGQ